MRRSLSLRCRQFFLLTALAALFGLASAAPAAAFLMAPGDNGDVKIHASTTPVSDERDQTHVCVFYLDAFNFDTVQHVSWTIHQQPPTGHALVAGGSITLTNGTGHTADMSLPAGHYKLTWTFAGEHGRAKFKVFWSTCEGKPTPHPSHSCACSASPSVPASSGASGKPGSGGGGSLAATGGETAGWVAVGAGALAAGSALIRRTRGSARHR
jgi:hypothetical protein